LILCNRVWRLPRYRSACFGLDSRNSQTRQVDTFFHAHSFLLDLGCSEYKGEKWKAKPKLRTRHGRNLLSSGFRRQENTRRTIVGGDHRCYIQQEEAVRRNNVCKISFVLLEIAPVRFVRRHHESVRVWHWTKSQEQNRKSEKENERGVAVTANGRLRLHVPSRPGVLVLSTGCPRRSVSSGCVWS